MLVASHEGYVALACLVQPASSGLDVQPATRPNESMEVFAAKYLARAVLVAITASGVDGQRDVRSARFYRDSNTSHVVMAVRGAVAADDAVYPCSLALCHVCVRCHVGVPLLLNDVRMVLRLFNDCQENRCVKLSRFGCFQNVDRFGQNWTVSRGVLSLCPVLEV